MHAACSEISSADVTMYKSCISFSKHTCTVDQRKHSPAHEGTTPCTVSVPTNISFYFHVIQDQCTVQSATPTCDVRAFMFCPDTCTFPYSSSSECKRKEEGT